MRYLLFAHQGLSNFKVQIFYNFFPMTRGIKWSSVLSLLFFQHVSSHWWNEDRSKIHQCNRRPVQNATPSIQRKEWIITALVQLNHYLSSSLGKTFCIILLRGFTSQNLIPSHFKNSNPLFIIFIFISIFQLTVIRISYWICSRYKVLNDPLPVILNWCDVLEGWQGLKHLPHIIATLNQWQAKTFD